MNKKLIYIAGPMRGIKWFNFPAFDAARDKLNAQGCYAISPADLDRQHADGFDPFKLPADYDWMDLSKIGFDLQSAVDRDVAAVKKCDAIYLLDGWEKSKGARAEKALAEWLGKEVLYEKTTGEVRVTDPVTGGQKGVKPERFDLLPVRPLQEIARVYGWGARKYADHNWAKGYKWGYSYGACQRHLQSFWDGEDKDVESGLLHLAHAAWHCLTLMWFLMYGKGTDDRLPKFIERGHMDEELTQ
jgi:hypothetical protein